MHIDVCAHARLFSYNVKATNVKITANVDSFDHLRNSYQYRKIQFIYGTHLNWESPLVEMTWEGFMIQQIESSVFLCMYADWMIKSINFTKTLVW